MRSTSSGPLTTLLMFVPLLAVPAMAIFGTPQFSASRDEADDDESFESEHRRALDPGVGESARHSPDDLFAPAGDRQLADRPGDSGEYRNDSDWNDSAERFEENSFDGARPANFPRRQPREDDLEPRSQYAFADDSESAEPRAKLARDPRQFDQPVAERTLSHGSPRATAMHAAGANQAGQPVAPEGNSFLSVQDEPLRRPTPRTGAERALDRRADEGSQFAENFAFTDSPEEPADEYASTDDNPFTSRRRAVATETSDSRPFDEPADAPAANTLTWQQAVQRLNALGIENYHLEPGADPSQFHFSCLFTPRDNPRLTHRFEAEAAEPLDAVSEVIAQVETWMERQ